MTLYEYIKKKNEILYKKQIKNKDNVEKLKKNYKTKKKELKVSLNFKLFLGIIILIFIFLICFKIYDIKHHRNYENEYFAFRYNQERIFINDYTEIANMWIVSTGGGLYAPSMIMIGYIKDAENYKIDEPLSSMQTIIGGEKSEEIKEIKSNIVTDDYILTLNGSIYRILSKSIKKNGSILTVMFVNGGELSEEEQAYLYQVYDTIILK